MKSTIAPLVSIVLLGLAACDSGPPAAPSPLRATSPSAAITPSSPTDPLEGEWHQRFTCEEQVRTFQRKLASWVHQGLPTGEDATLSLAALSKKYTDFAWGPSAKTATIPTPDALCKGAPERERIIRFQAGSLMIFNAWDQTVEMDARYWMIGARTFAANDGNGDLGGTPRFTFHLHGDRMTFKRLGKPDPWGDTYFEMAPFVRLGD
jgi:hypothetical protein